VSELNYGSASSTLKFSVLNFPHGCKKRMFNVMTGIRLEVAPLVATALWCGETQLPSHFIRSVCSQHVITVTLATKTEGSAPPIHPCGSSIHLLFSQYDVGDTIPPYLQQCQLVHMDVLSMPAGRFRQPRVTKVLIELHRMVGTPANIMLCCDNHTSSDATL
jgi:hypothetical protein